MGCRIVNFEARLSHVVSTLMITTIGLPKKTTVEGVALEPHCYMTVEIAEPVTDERLMEELVDQL